LFGGCAAGVLDQEARVFQHHGRVELGQRHRLAVGGPGLLYGFCACGEGSCLCGLILCKACAGCVVRSGRFRVWVVVVGGLGAEPAQRRDVSLVLCRRHSPVVSMTIFSCSSSRLISVKGSWSTISSTMSARSMPDARSASSTLSF